MEQHGEFQFYARWARSAHQKCAAFTWQNKIHKFFFRMQNCMHAIVTTSGYSEPETCRNIIYITWNVDVCTAPTAVCSSSPHSRPKWLQLMLYIHMYIHFCDRIIICSFHSLYMHLHQPPHNPHILRHSTNRSICVFFEGRYQTSNDIH